MGAAESACAEPVEQIRRTDSQRRARVNTAHSMSQRQEDMSCKLDKLMISSLTAFEVLHVLGEGGFGKVVMVRKRHDGSMYALKCIDKWRIRSGALDFILSESQAMQDINHPFVVRMFGAFQDSRHFFFLFELVRGGDMFQVLMSHNGVFPLHWCRFYLAELSLALDHIHTLGYVRAP